MEIDHNLVINIYEREISKHVKNKNRLYTFEINKEQNFSIVMRMLETGNLGKIKYNVFPIYEPKCRLVMSLSVKDKLINHYITKTILEKKLTKYLDFRNVATRKDMGTKGGIELALKYINTLKRKYKTFYCLKLDISKYFYSIDHNVLKGLIKDKLEPFEYNLIEQVINSTNKPYINKIIDKINKKLGASLPKYYFGKGLPIGNMTSQFLSIYYLYELDHYIVHNLHLKYYVRYMDDFLIFSDDLAKLKEAKIVIEDILVNKYKLKLNNKKSFIVNMKYGFSFLGYTYKIRDNKTIVHIKKSNLENVKKKIKRKRNDLKRGFVNNMQAFSSVMNYTFTYNYSYNRKVIKLINKYFYEK